MAIQNSFLDGSFCSVCHCGQCYSASAASLFHCSAAALGLPCGHQCVDQSVLMSAAEKLVASAGGFRSALAGFQVSREKVLNFALHAF